MELIEQILKQLKAKNGIDSPEIKALLATIKVARPDLYDIAMKIIENWVPDPNPSPNPLSKYIPDRNTLIGGGAGIAGLASLPFVPQLLGWLQNFPLPEVKDPMWLLPIVAGLGALAGAVYSIYAFRGIVSPTFGEKDGALTLTRYGILNELFFGAMAAVTTIWLSTVGLAPGAANAAPPAAANPLAANPPVPNPPAVNIPANKPNLLSYSVVAGSLVSGWFGARMRTFRLGRDLLQGALADSALNDKLSVGISDQIRNAPTAAAAATLATGKDVVGANVLRTTVTVPVKTELETQLFKHLDEMRVQTGVSKLGPLNHDGAWLTLGELKSFDAIDPIIRQVLGNFNLKESASSSNDDFIAKAKVVGLDLPQLTSLLTSIQSAAREVMGILGQQPANWKWPT